MELYLRFKKDSPLHEMKEDTIKAVNGEDVPDRTVKQLESDVSHNADSHQDDAVVEERKDWQRRKICRQRRRTPLKLPIPIGWPKRWLCGAHTDTSLYF